MRDITAITIHHTADVPRETGTDLDRVVAMRAYHVNELGWSDISYHRLVGADGVVHLGRSLALDPDSRTDCDFTGHIFVALIGNFEEEHPTPLALARLRQLTAQLCKDFELSAMDVHPHCAFVDTLCPGKHLLAATQ